MFGFGLLKLLVLVAIVVAVWYGFRWLARYQQVQNSRKPPDRVDSARDTVQCPVCGAFVVAEGATACGRGDCPYGR